MSEIYRRHMSKRKMEKGETKNKRVKIKIEKDREDTQRGGKRKREVA